MGVYPAEGGTRRAGRVTRVPFMRGTGATTYAGLRAASVARIDLYCAPDFSRRQRFDARTGSVLD